MLPAQEEEQLSNTERSTRRACTESVIKQGYETHEEIQMVKERKWRRWIRCGASSVPAARALACCGGASGPVVTSLQDLQGFLGSSIPSGVLLGAGPAREYLAVDCDSLINTRTASEIV